MESQKLIEEIRRAVTEVKEKSQEMVSVNALINYLNSLEKEVEEHRDFDQRKFESEITVFRAEHERNLAHYDAQQQHSLELLRSVIAYGQAALKSAILINGGAAAALLAFIGNIWAKGIVPQAVSSITNAIIFFSSGVLASAFGTGTTYLTQYCYSEEWNKSAKLFHILTIIVVLFSYFLFAMGAYASYEAFVKHLALG